MEAHSRAMVLGVWEGLLICYLVESGKTASSSDDGGRGSVAYYANVLGTGLAFGVGSRLFLDYTTTGDVEVLARGVVGMTVGVLVAEFARHALLVYYDTPIVSDLKRKHRRRVHTHTQTDEEVVEGNIPPETSRSVAVTTSRAAPSSSRTRPTVNTSTTVAEPVRVPVLSAGVTRDMLRAGRRDIGDDDHESEESLERDVTHANGQRRRLQEEREWARAKGDAARSAELDNEIRRYKALSAELEKRLQRRRSTVYSTASSKNSKATGPRQNTLILVDDRDASQRPQFIHLLPDPLPEQPTSAAAAATAPSAPVPSRVRVLPTRAGSLPPAPTVNPTPDPAPTAPIPRASISSPALQSTPIIAAPPTDATAAAASSRRSRSQTRRSLSTRVENLPETGEAPRSRRRKASGTSPGPSSAAPAESSSTPYEYGKRTSASPSRKRRRSTPSKRLPSVYQVPISSEPSTAPVRPSAPAEDAAPPPVPPKRSTTPSLSHRARIALGKRPLRDPLPTPTKFVPAASTSAPAPAPAPATTAGPSQPLPLPHDPPDPKLVQRILGTAPARDRRPVPITIRPRVQMVPIHDNKPPTEDSTGPESSDDWSRALD